MKPFYLLCTLLLVSLYSHAQSFTSFTLQIRVPDSMPLDKLVVSYGDGLNQIDLKPEEISHSMVLKGTLHTLFGSLSLAIKGDNGLYTRNELFFFLPGNCEIVLKDTSLQTTKEVGIHNTKSKKGKEFDEFTAKERAYLTQLMLEWNKLGAYNAELAQKAQQAVLASNRKTLEFINTHESDYFSFYQFYSNFTPFQQFFPADSLLQVFSRFPEGFKNTDVGKKLSQELNGLDSLRKKGLAPNFITQDVHGDKLSLVSLRGNYVILDFWATWCGPCMKAMPGLIELSNKYPAVKVLSVSLDRDTTSHLNAIKKLPASWTYIYKDSHIIDGYGVVAIPAIFLVDPNGKVVGTDIASIEKTLQNAAGN
jgi:thiol-disulfide isomerase/thioredoxin